jgi:hypothetical protein
MRLMGSISVGAGMNRAGSDIIVPAVFSRS